MVGRRGEAPLVPPYSFRSPNKALALRVGVPVIRVEDRHCNRLFNQSCCSDRTMSCKRSV